MAKFKLPPSFLNQLSEFSTGYLLVTIDSDGNFEIHLTADTPVKQLAMRAFIGMLADHLHENSGINGFPQTGMNKDGELEYLDDDDDDEE